MNKLILSPEKIRIGPDTKKIYFRIEYRGSVLPETTILKFELRSIGIVAH